MAERSAAARPALLFIPDISGFTQFVNEVEISHSQHIIEELLEGLIESNQLGMKISEIEGDAILFYKDGKIPDGEQIAEQCKNMFIAFHHQLRKYDLSRICDCGACSTANKLTLKIIAHQGNISFSKVKDHEKLFGSDVILVHRLLKNDIPEHEYMLVTENILLSDIASRKEYNWIQLNKGSSTYDMGEVKYNYSSFKGLYNSISEPQTNGVKEFRTSKPLIFEEEIEAPMEIIYQALINLPERMKYMQGIKEVVVHDEHHNKMNKIGTRHECIREDSTSDVITSSVEFGKERIQFSETAAGHKMTCDYTLESKGEITKVRMSLYMLLGFPQKLMFNLFMKNKVAANIRGTISGLKKYCEEKFRLSNSKSEKNEAHATEHSFQASSLG